VGPSHGNSAVRGSADKRKDPETVNLWVWGGKVRAPVGGRGVKKKLPRRPLGRPPQVTLYAATKVCLAIVSRKEVIMMNI